ncbi:Ig-like domain-containing protein [Sediminibacterium soli]|uniref:Ig-like domain-containing protein n=1 Tax=Sediminibacterium soli TaxID=2698829 RepID=UPI001379E95C|nr:Ig-like domain-containing protein [Sediminibacterium soli]NCI47742.1 Ig-like domain-containing protein [Sediminibacterium soli]
MRISFVQLFCLGLLAVTACGLFSCANIIPPGGGPRDTLPPRLVMAQPKDSSVNVSPRQINLVFDEYVTLDNWYSNLIVSPALKYPLNVNAKLRNITVTIRDTLEPNTTYLLDFGNAVRDVNESNVARNFRYAFATGGKLDANSYSGKVILAQTGKTDSNMYVMLYRDLSDSAVYKTPPRYYTRMNGRGEFSFHNLPDGRFAVYVIDNRSPMKTYTDSSLLFAFRDAPVAITASTKQDTLYAYHAYTKKEIGSASPARPQANADKRLRYTAQMENGQQDILDSMKLVFQKRLTVFDSGKLVLYDTGYRKLAGYSLQLDSTRTKISLVYPWQPNTAYRLIIAKDAVADSLGATLAKADTIRFTTKKETDYGSIRIRFPNIDLSRNPILQLVKNDAVVESFPLIRNEVTRKLYRPGSYDVQILYDTNKNGVWDPGQFLPNRRQPEIVERITKQILVRANWDNDVTL